MKVALVHDWLIGWGGAEQVLWALHECFPEAPVYTALFSGEQLPAGFQNLEIHTSFLQNLPGAIRHYQKLLPLMPLAFESFDLSDYDLVISSSHACAKGVLTGPDTYHLSYIHTPIRYAWDMYYAYMEDARPGKLKKALMHGTLHYLRQWDTLNTRRIEGLLCNSHFVRRRIQKYYGRKATVLHPPVTLPAYTQAPREDFYLSVGRLVSYKRVDLLIEAFRHNGRRLKIVGDGPERKHLIKDFPPQIEYLGALPRAEIEALYQRARALVFPPLEDFGMVPIEAQGAGCPVIAFGRGGALDSVRPDTTGVFFEAQTPESLNAAIARFETLHFDEKAIRHHAEGFDVRTFKQKLMEHINEIKL